MLHNEITGQHRISNLFSFAKHHSRRNNQNRTLGIVRTLYFVTLKQLKKFILSFQILKLRDASESEYQSEVRGDHHEVHRRNIPQILPGNVFMIN